MRLRLPPLIVALAFTLAPIAHAGVTPRIVGGSPAGTGVHPYAAALVVPGFAKDSDGSFCGATAIAPYAFLTAAHCIVQDLPGGTRTLTPPDLVVVTGKTDLSLAGGQHLAVRKLVTHTAFSPPPIVANDIAVVLTSTPTTATPIARATATSASGTATAIGWGATDAAGTIFSAQLMQADLLIQPGGDCPDAALICAGSTSPNICIGDSGGPLIVSTPAGVQQVGISSVVLMPVSATTPCGHDSSEFTDVSLYTAWVDAQLVPEVSGVAVFATAGNKLRVAWQRIPGGAEPAIVIATSDGTFRSAPAGATSLDIAGLPAGRALRATVTVSNAWGTATGTSVGTATLAARPVATVKPKLRGTARVGKTLTCGAGTWKAAPAPKFTYGWRIGGKVSRTQKKSTLKLTNAMRAKSVSCVVTAKNAAAAVTVRSAAVTVRRR